MKRSVATLVVALAIGLTSAGCGGDDEIKPGGVKVGTVDGTARIQVPEKAKPNTKDTQSREKDGR